VARPCGEGHAPSAWGEHLRRQEKPASQPNEAWVADITYLRVGGKWMYLAAIMDVYSRRIIGWSMANTRTMALTLRALRHAMRSRRMVPGGVFHTDRGIEYRGAAYQERLKKWGIRPSVNRPGYCTDNAHIESFFHSLKAEPVRGAQYKTEGQLRNALNGYINRFYNHRRMHSGIGYHTPAEFERITV
jgi:putative transposase